VHSKRAVSKRRIPENGAYRNAESTLQYAKIANHLKEFNARAESVKQTAARAKSG